MAIKPSGGAYVVTYDGTVSSGAAALVAEVSSSDKVTTLDAGARSNPVVSINGANQYLVTYTSNDGGDLNIRRRIGHL